METQVEDSTYNYFIVIKIYIIFSVDLLFYRESQNYFKL